MSLAILFLLSYLIGGIPFGYMAGHIVLKTDIRTLGSGNLGASNVFRQVGPGWGIGVLLLDASKGLAVIFLAKTLFPTGADWISLSAGVLAILGHSFTPYLGFRGGKGVATSAGVFLGLAPAALGLAFAVFVITMLIARMVSMSSLMGALALPVALWILYPEKSIILFASLFVAALVWYRHRSNIGRILKGEEPRFKIRGKEA
ncbi:glycerol-3-phosphate 1-O-acyltransferase PlsY [bacterium]|nr:glycerol-3-phosphate 1-O-acyltransferase PlsY [bacterium]